MSIRFDAATDYLSRTASAPGDPRSVSFWMYIAVDLNTYGVPFIISDGVSNFDAISLDSDGTTLRINATGSSVTGSNLSVGQWYHIAYTRNGTTRKLYLDGVLDITNTAANTFTASQFAIGSDSVSYLNGRLAFFKMWAAELTVDEVVREKNSIRPQRIENLWAFYPTRPGAGVRNLDTSGNGRDLTDNAGVADEADPPLRWGPQTSLLGVG